MATVNLAEIREIIDQVTNTYNCEIEANKNKAESRVYKLFYNGQQQATHNLHSKIRDALHSEDDIKERIALARGAR